MGGNWEKDVVRSRRGYREWCGSVGRNKKMQIQSGKYVRLPSVSIILERYVRPRMWLSTIMSTIFAGKVQTAWLH